MPPEILYHGTTPGALPAIRKGGLRSMKRQYVHLSASIETATRVAERRTETAVILAVHAGEAARSGVEFFHPEPELYLAKAVPSQYIDILEV